MMYCSLEEAFYSEPTQSNPYNYDYTSQFQTIQSQVPTVPSPAKEHFQDLYSQNEEYVYIPKCLDVEEHFKHCKECYNKYKQRDNTHHIIIIILILLLIWSAMSK